MPALAKTIELVQGPGGYSLKIDGKEFPWHVVEEITQTISWGELPGVRVEIIAERVVVEHQSRG